ncbi:MAG: winged helix DNA-binding domain-containing protein [Myxococcales bacterium]|nr:winged helix DNA-binding domain-containing protein [Myxococcales bacterium]
MARLTAPELGVRRLWAQHVGGTRFTRPEDVVRALVAVQAQDPLAARWALGVRLPGSTETQVIASLDRGDILRTHLMRGTWQYVVPDDLPWLTELLGPGARSQAVRRHQQLGLDEKTFTRAESVLTRSLERGPMTRAALRAVLEEAGISTEGQRLSHLVVELELRGLLCSGPHVEGDATWCLVEHRVKRRAPKRSREEALGELARRFFVSRGPATVADFRWWAGLSATEAKAAHAAVRSELDSTSDGAVTWWWREASASGPAHALLPAFDEFLISYVGRDEVLDPRHVKRINAGGGLLAPCIVDEGRVVGVWRRELQKAQVEVSTTWFSSAAKWPQRLVAKSFEAYGRFLGLSVKQV